MLKATVFIPLMLMACVLCVMSLSCESCGNECALACGSRRFRSCCFNYLRKKRQDQDNTQQSKMPALIFKDFLKGSSGVWSNNLNIYSQNNDLQNRIEDI